MELYSRLLNEYENFVIITESMNSETDDSRYIASIYCDEKLLLKGDYIYIGSFSKSKNVWIWADKSMVLDKNMVNIIKKKREKLLKYEEYKDFVTKDYDILPIDVILKNLENINLLLKENIIISHNDDICFVISIHNIIFNDLP